MNIKHKKTISMFLIFVMIASIISVSATDITNNTETISNNTLEEKSDEEIEATSSDTKIEIIDIETPLETNETKNLTDTEIDETKNDTIIVNSSNSTKENIEKININELGLIDINSMELIEEIPDFNSEESKQDIQNVIEMIEMIPEYNDEMSDEEMENFLTSLGIAYIHYEDLYPQQQEKVTNSDKILLFKDFLSNEINVYTAGNSFNINAINRFGSTNQIALVYGDGVKTIKQISNDNFRYWDAYVFDTDANGRYVVTKIVKTTSSGNSKGTLIPPKNGFILLFHGKSATKANSNLSLGAEILVDFDYRNTNSGTSSSGFGTITIEKDRIRTVNITAINSFDISGNTVNLIYGEDGQTVKDVSLDKTNSFYYWVAYVIRECPNYDGWYQIEDLKGSGSKFGMELENNTVILMVHGTQEEILKKMNIGDYVSIDFDFKSEDVGVRKDGFGTVTFTEFEPEEDGKMIQNNQLTPIENPISTKDLIDINLYEFSYIDDNNHINSKFNEDNKYLGFQNPGGVQYINSLTENSFKFGDNITSDLKAGRNDITNLKLQNINGTTDNSNSPISKVLDVMQNVIGEDGYPALNDGTSLSYLFDESESYITKVNQPQLDGLFQYNEETGEYFFDCHNNHAQYNPETNYIDLYKEKISANFMMYPFGNFLPFNDIQTATKSNKITRKYFRQIAVTAKEKAQNEEDEEISNAYSNLSSMLNKFVAKMDDYQGNKEWTAVDATNAYFASAAKLDSEMGEIVFPEEVLSDIYSIDYDDFADFYFGMTLEMDFSQPKNGMTGTNNAYPMIFNFAGDDDVWVYIDDILFLDLSGIHRHIGGKIDYKEGTVSYYRLDSSKGDNDIEPYEVITFEEIISSSMGEDKVDELLKKDNNGNYTTFKDYGVHNFKFYYIERGSGSSICKMNFNFPLLKSNSLAIGKNVSIDNENVEYLGNPEYIFQVMKANENDIKTNTSFFKEGEIYEICMKDENGNLISLIDEEGNKKIGKVDKDGFIYLKDGEYANFPTVPVGTSCFYVRELLSKNIYEQYDRVTSLDSVIIEPNKYVTYNNIEYATYETPIRHLLDGDTLFEFDNRIISDKLGALEIEKVVTDRFDSVNKNEEFKFIVKIDGKLLPIGTQYFIGSQTKSVEKEGEIVLRHNEKGEIKHLLSGSEYIVVEVEDENYDVKYTNDIGIILPADIDENGNPITPTVKMKAVNDKNYDFAIIKRDSKTKEPLANAEFELKNETITYIGLSGEDGIISWKDINGNDVENLAIGTYTLTETKAPNEYFLNSDSWNVVIKERSFSITSKSEIVSQLDNNTKYFYFEDKPIIRLGNLSITKTISGTALTEKDSFKFHIKFSDESLNGKYGDIVLSNGEADFFLKGGETKTIENLAKDTEYILEEIDSNTEITVIEGSLTGKIIEGNNKISINNHKDKVLSDLIIKKTISGNALKETDSFTFQVILSEKVNGTFGDVVFKDGITEFTLKANETKTISAIEVGTSYEIKELDFDGDISSEGNLNGIISKEPTEIVINNHKDIFGNLILKKTVSGTDVDANTIFTFKIILSEKINKIIGDVQFKDGIAEVSLKANESIFIDGLDVGLAYEIVEITEGYTSSVTKGNLKGNITEGNTEIIINNHRDKTTQPVGDLKITKKISGTALTDKDEFKFKLILSEKLNGNYGDVSFKNGITEFTLKANEAKTIKGLPVNTKYTLTETDSKDSKMTVPKGSMEGTINEGIIEIIINNHKDKTVIEKPKTEINTESVKEETVKEEIKNNVPTGDSAPVNILIGLLIISILGIVILKKKK